MREGEDVHDGSFVRDLVRNLRELHGLSDSAEDERDTVQIGDFVSHAQHGQCIAVIEWV